MTTPHSRIPYLPARIEGLSTLSMNLWWSWSREARALFRSIDEALWHLTRHNPLELLCRVDPARIAACASDSDFLRRYRRDDADAARDLEQGHLVRPHLPGARWETRRLLLCRIRSA